MIKGLDIVTKNLEMGDEIKIHIHRGGELNNKDVLAWLPRSRTCWQPTAV